MSNLRWAASKLVCVGRARFEAGTIFVRRKIDGVFLRYSPWGERLSSQ